MKHRFTLLFALLVCLQSAHAQSGRKLPYPIIFVHGWTGNDADWLATGEQLQAQSLNVALEVNVDANGKRKGQAAKGSRIDFNLDADGRLGTSKLHRGSIGLNNYGDVYDFDSYVNPNNDIFFINFDREEDKYSSQSAAVKQGFAVGLAVRKVLQATKADKVILFGHSMGGLAIREYLQNKANWLMGDGQHHVAKLITSGTPHRGSNANSFGILKPLGKDERSEAVRDLRYPKPSSQSDRRVYLFGGNESEIDRLGLDYYNNDVDCNGYIGDEIQGLNFKDLYLDVAYTCIIGIGGDSYTGLIGPNDDDVVEADRASLFNLGYPNINGDVFYINKSDAEARANNYYTFNDAFTWHTRLPKQSFINMYALDEPETKDLAYQIQINKDYRGFLTPHPNGYNPNGYNQDTDLYKLYFSSRGIAELYLQISNASQPVMKLYDNNNNLLSSTSDGTYKVPVNNAGTYYLSISGNGGDASFTWHFNDYTYHVNFCPEPDQLVVSASTPTELCDGQRTVLTATRGYDSYRWYLDNKEIIAQNSSQILASVSGTFSVQGIKNCGINRSATNTVKLTVKPSPAAPTVAASTVTYCVGDVAQPLSATGTQLQWYTQATGGTASAVAPTVSTANARSVTYYVTQTGANGCESVRQPITINVTVPPSAPGVAANQYVCQFAQPVPLTAQGQNLLWRGSSLTAASETAPSPATDKVDTLRYTVTQRAGSCVSPAANVTITVRKAPEAPKVVTPVSYCINTKANVLGATGTANNTIKWYTKADRSGQQYGVIIPPTDNAGQFTYYATQIDANGCESLTNPVSVTVKPKPTATLPNDTAVFRYDSVAVRIALTGDAPWRVTLWNGRELTATQSPLTVYVRPTATATYALQSVTNECGLGSTGRTMRITLLEPLAVDPTLPNGVWLNPYPNPASSQLTVEWNAPVGQPVVIRLLTQTGVVVLQHELRGRGIPQTLPMTLDGLSGGVYILQLATKQGDVISRKLIRQ